MIIKILGPTEPKIDINNLDHRTNVLLQIIQIIEHAMDKINCTAVVNQIINNLLYDSDDIKVLPESNKNL
jgi:hypothetical protein